MSNLQKFINMAKAIILSRVSTEQQTLNSQTEAIKKEASKEGFKDDELIIIEDKESATKLSEEDRHGLNRMKEEIEADSSITHVFVYEPSRISRRQAVLFSIRDYLIENKIQLICCNPYFRLLEDGKMSQTANLVFSIYASMAESEMQLKQERMRRGKMMNKMTGKNDQGAVLYGYTTLEDKTIVIDEEKSKLVIDLFTLYATGFYSIATLAMELMKRYGEADWTVGMTKSKVSHIMRTERYCGDSQYPQLISRELFEMARAAAMKNKMENKHFERCDALLKKIIFSKKTGHAMTYNGTPGKHRYITNYEAPMVTVQTKHIDAEVFKLTEMLHKAYILDSKKIRKQIQEKIDACLEKEMNLKVNSIKWREKIDKVEERLIFGKLSEEKAEALADALEKQIADAQNDIKKIEEEMSHLKQLIESSNIEQLPDYGSFSMEEKIHLIRQMIKRVEVERPKVSEIAADVYTNVDNFIYTLHINTYNRKTWMSSRMCLDEVSQSSK